MAFPLSFDLLVYSTGAGELRISLLAGGEWVIILGFVISSNVVLVLPLILYCRMAYDDEMGIVLFYFTA